VSENYGPIEEGQPVFLRGVHANPPRRGEIYEWHRGYFTEHVDGVWWTLYDMVEVRGGIWSHSGDSGGIYFSPTGSTTADVQGSHVLGSHMYTLTPGGFTVRVYRSLFSHVSVIQSGTQITAARTHTGL